MDNLAKVRVEVARRMEMYKCGTHDAYGVLSDVLSFIDSLTGEKEEMGHVATVKSVNPDGSFEVYTEEDSREAGEEETQPEQWKPVKGEEIEVSNDGERWYKYVFLKMASGTYICHVDTDHGEYDCSYRFARPIPEMNEPYGKSLFTPND